MIPANKKPVLDSLFYYYLTWVLRRRFYAIRARGLEHLQQLPDSRPTLAFSNHCNWWDGLIVFFLTRFAPQKHFYCMMEEKQLCHYQFFTWIGAFSVDLSSPLRAAASVRYAVKLMQENQTLIWIFPQGALSSSYERIQVKPGTNYLATRAGSAQLLPVAFRYEFFREDRPEVLIEFGEPISAPDSSDEKIQELCQTLADRLEEVARTRNFLGFSSLLSPKWTINKRWEWVRYAVRGRLHEFNPSN